MRKEKTLFILHYTPPIHGASKVGDTILRSKRIKRTLNSEFVKIKSSNSLLEIGSFKINKIWFLFELFFKVVYHLVFFRPNIIYFTASPRGFAFYRDLVISIPIKVYCTFKRPNCSVYYHYHAKGIYEFTKSSLFAKKLTSFFIKNANIILISSLMENELELLKSYKKIIILNNGVPNNLNENSFKGVLGLRENIACKNILYLSNMMKEKGYDKVLGLAKEVKLKNIQNVHFHFAGAWSSTEDETFFNEFVRTNDLFDTVTYHGLVTGKTKMKLFKTSHLFIFPTIYKREVFPLSILEAMSFGLPVLTFNKGAISEIVNTSLGIISNSKDLFNDFETIKKNYLNLETYKLCRKHFLDNYTEGVFEINLINILKGLKN